MTNDDFMQYLILYGESRSRNKNCNGNEDEKNLNTVSAAGLVPNLENLENFENESFWKSQRKFYIENFLQYLSKPGKIQRKKLTTPRLFQVFTDTFTKWTFFQVSQVLFANMIEIQKGLSHIFQESGDCG